MMKRIVSLLLMILFLFACGVDQKEKLTQIITTNPTYPETVKLLGEPDFEELSNDITEIIYKQDYEFYGLVGTLYVGFNHSPSANNRAKDEFIGLGFMAMGDDTELIEAKDQIIRDYDKLFGNYKYDRRDNCYSWKDELRNTINLQIDDGFLIFGYGSYYNNPFNF